MPHIGYFPIIYYPKPLPISPSDFLSGTDTMDWNTTGLFLRNRVDLGLQNFYAPVYLPQGAIVTKLILYGYRDDALATLEFKLEHHDREGNKVIMAQVVADWISGYLSGFDDSITDPVIDNENRGYHVMVTIEPNDSFSDVAFMGALIEWR